MQSSIPLKTFVAAGFIIAGGIVLAERNPMLPPPDEGSSRTKISHVIGWPAGRTPQTAEGFTVTLFLDLKGPRRLVLLPSGDVLVSQDPSNGGDQIQLLKFKGSQLESHSVLTKDVHKPFGMAPWHDQLFIAGPERVRVFPFDGQHITGAGRTIATLPYPLPRRHWTRDLLISPDGKKLYVSVGSVSNVGEAPDPRDPHNAAILEMNLDGSGQRIFASGLRNAVTIAWEPTTHVLWAVVNERDELGDNLPPDYLTHVVDGGFYGWPYAYWGQHEDPRLKNQRPDLVKKSITPDFSVGPHTAPLGLVFTHGTKLPAPFNEGALVVQHGSWNRSTFSGYKVLYVPFENGQAVDGEKDFLTGFIANESQSTVYGRPVTAVILNDGSVLVSDDGAGRIWKVSPSTQYRH